MLSVQVLAGIKHLMEKWEGYNANQTEIISKY